MGARSTTVPDVSLSAQVTTPPSECVEPDPSRTGAVRPSAGDRAHRHAGPLATGAIFGGRYRIVRCLAAGGMGAVYEVVHVETERRRALKVMHPHLFRSDDMRERFKREARIAAGIESEHIVDVSDAGVDEATDTPFLVMELLAGEELGARLERLGQLSPAEVVTILCQVAVALDKTHAKSIVHRDLKPENLFVTAREDGSPRVKILDFGLAKVVAEGGAAVDTTGRVGTPLYMAPEQLRAAPRLTPAVDIYALGMMAYTLMVGQPYWRREADRSGDLVVFALLVAEGPRESARSRAEAEGVSLPEAFDPWFARATAQRPEDRFQAASEAALALADALGVKPGDGIAALSNPSLRALPAAPLVSNRASISTAATVAAPEQKRPWGRRGQIAAAAALAALVGALAVLLATRSSGPIPMVSAAVPDSASRPAQTGIVGAPGGASVAAPAGTASASVAVPASAPPAADVASAPSATGSAPSAKATTALPVPSATPRGTSSPATKPAAGKGAATAATPAPAPTPTSLFGRDN